jgi:hypothetical protein
MSHTLGVHLVSVKVSTPHSSHTKEEVNRRERKKANKENEQKKN